MKKNIIKKIIKTLAFLGCIIIVYLLLDFIAVDDNSANRLLYHEFYEQEEINIAMVGSSSVMRGFNPLIADDILGVNTFNLGTASQTMDGTYWQTRELLDRFDVDTVFIDVNFSILQRKVGDHKTTWIMTDYMRGINKYKFIFDIAAPEDYLTMLSGVYRTRGEITVDSMIENIEAKTSEEYRNYEYYNNIYTNYNNYVGKGFGILDKENAGYDFFCYPSSYGEFDIVNEKKINKDEISYLKKSIELCQERNVDVVLVTIPKSDFYNSKCGEYGVFQELIEGIAEEYGIEWYDFNLIRDVDFGDEYFTNLDHLDEDGATLFTETLCKLYSGEEQYGFYDVLDEVPDRQILGITYDMEEIDGRQYHLSWQIVSDWIDADFQYRIVVKNGSDTVMLDTGIISENEIEIHRDNDSKIELYIYDGEGEFLGDALFLRL